MMCLFRLGIHSGERRRHLRNTLDSGNSRSSNKARPDDRGPEI